MSAAVGRDNLVVVVGSCEVTWGQAGIWIVRRSLDGGKTWSVVEEISHGKDADAGAWSAMLTRDGTIYVIGHATDAKKKSHWLVRKSSDRGKTRQTADDYADGRSPMGEQLVELGHGEILASGQVKGGRYANDWRLHFRRGIGTWRSDVSLHPGRRSGHGQGDGRRLRRQCLVRRFRDC